MRFTTACLVGIVIFLTITFVVSCGLAPIRTLSDGSGKPIAPGRFPVRVTFDCSIDDLSQKQIWNGIVYWNKLLKREVFVLKPCSIIMFSDDRDVFVYRSYSSTSRWDNISNLFAVVVSYPTTKLNDVMVFMNSWDKSRNIAFKESVARHEAGHVLGLLDRQDYPYCLMHKAMNEDMTAYKEACHDEIRAIKKLHNF